MMAPIRGGCGDEEDSFEAEPDEFDDEADEPDFGDDGEVETESCPKCGRDIPEDTVRCPYCGDYVTPGGEAAAGRRTWLFVATAVAVVVIVVLWTL